MQFCIVSPATISEFDRETVESEAMRRIAEHAPVGVLTLAAVLARQGPPPDIVCLNVLYCDYLDSSRAGRGDVDFCTYAADRILSLDFDAIGLGTICSTYPLTLRIAARVRAARPDVPIVLGGPQASAVDRQTLEWFPQIDFILRYEAEESLPHLLRTLENGHSVSAVKGLTYRQGGQVVRAPSAPPIENLDALPLPAYELYPYLRQARYIPLELGRGCPYACTFCSTNDFFRRDFRLKTPKLIVEQMLYLKREYDVPVFDLIHDMFTVNRKKVVEFCNELIATGEKFTWNCSARTDRVDAELLELMEEAGCGGIFFGIETGSQRLQTVLQKNLILSDAMSKIKAASGLGLETAVSLISGFPTETEADFAETADFFARALRHENAVPQFHILAPLADTPIEREYRDRLHFDDIVSDMSHQGWEQDPADRDLISRYPDVFANFYAVPTALNRPYIKEVRAFLLYGSRAFRWLLAALHRERGHILDVYGDFRRWLEQKRPEFFASGVDVTSYYRSPQFVPDFPEFVRERYVVGLEGGAALGALVDLATSFGDIAVDDPYEDAVDAPTGTDGRIIRTALCRRSVPIVAGNVRLVRADFDCIGLMNAVSDGQPLASVPRARTVLASRKQPGRWPEVLQLSDKSLALLELCDGERSVADVSVAFGRRFRRNDGISPEQATLVGLELLRHDNLIVEAPRPKMAAQRRTVRSADRLVPTDEPTLVGPI
jgi:radical SAM superfamily enzyme YgiQ (UPF0313 family)